MFKSKIFNVALSTALIIIIFFVINISSSGRVPSTLPPFPFRDASKSGKRPILDQYDFVIVGGGPAGCVVANRLTENPNWNVLLIEAGQEESYFNQLAPIAHYFQYTKFNWNYLTEYQSGACLGLVNSRCPWPAGKGLGGASLINNNIYTRGNRKDYDDWANLGNVGWSYEEVLPYFLKSEDNNIGYLKKSPYHGVGGPLPIEYAPFRSGLMEAFLNSSKEVGLNVVDYNNPFTHHGFSPIQGTMRYGRKVSAYRSFIRPYYKRENLHIIINSRVTRIIMDDRNGIPTAIGVEFVNAKKRYKVFARKEVVLSAGAFNSPQLLMLSGIGPREHLQQMGIQVVRDLRVGDNLQEHPAFANLAFTVNQTAGLIVERLVANPVSTVLDWGQGTGFTTISGCEGLGYVNTKYNTRRPDPPPDIEFIFLPISLAGEGGIAGTVLRRTMGIPDSTYFKLYNKIENKDAWNIWTMLMYPISRGFVRLKSANPLAYPIVQSNFFAEPLDLYTIVEGIKMVIELSETNTFQRLGSTLNPARIPNCEAFRYKSDDYWACAVRQLTMQMHHQCCTNKMGPEWDRNAVVNPRLKVYGVNGLRVADVSIMPKIPGAHTVASAYMIGEKAADLIKADHLDENTKKF